MVKSTNIPFYLDSVQPNIITENEIDHFVLTNPTLAKFIHNNLIELRLISLTTFEAFCYWIIGQQISGNAANAISIRFKKLLQSVNPDNTLIQNVDILKKVGLSSSKANYVLNLANFFINNEMPDFPTLTSQEIINYFSQIKGIGEWTVQMHLIFGFGRKDILAAKDLVVRKGISILYDLPSIPSEKEVYGICKHWGDLSTLGTILAWAVMGE